MSTIIPDIFLSDSPCLKVYPEGEMSTSTLMMLARRFAKSILSLPGYQPGKHLAIFMPNGLDSAVSLIGSWLAGVVPAFLNTVGMPNEINHCIQLIDPLLIIENEFIKVPNSVKHTCPIFTFSKICKQSKIRISDDELIINHNLDAVLLFTSGSSGRPKGVRISHKGLQYSIAGLTNVIKPHNEVFLLQVPMHHIFGIVTLLLAITSRSGAVFSTDFQADKTLEAIDRESATIGFGPPEMFLSMANCPLLYRFKLNSFKRVLLGGSPCRETQLLEIEHKLNLETIYLSFGMTETTGGISLAPFRDKKGNTKVHAGYPVNTIKIDIVANKKKLPPEKEGEICFSGPHLMFGYLGQTPLFKDSIIYSGDLGKIDSKGYLHVTGRIKEIIIKAGENISIAEVENVLLKCPEVKEACVIGFPDHRLGENIAAIVVTNNPNFTKRDLQKYCLDKLLKSKIPQKIIFQNTLPLLPTGKVDRHTACKLILSKISNKQK